MTEPVFHKSRDAARPGSIPDVLQMFPREVRFHRELAPYVGVRVPACYRSEERDGATRLELEDLSDWSEGADPAAATQMLAGLHARWEGALLERWPWLPRPDVRDLVEKLYDETWADARGRSELTDTVRGLGDSLVGRVAEIDRRAEAAGPTTLCHGDASGLEEALRSACVQGLLSSPSRIPATTVPSPG
jgi:hypothetical protein